MDQEKQLILETKTIFTPLLPLLTPLKADHDTSLRKKILGVLMNASIVTLANIISIGSVLLYIEPSAKFIYLLVDPESPSARFLCKALSGLLVTGGVGSNFGVSLFTALALLLALKQFLKHNRLPQIILKALAHIPYTIMSVAAAYAGAGMAIKTLFISKQQARYIELVANYIAADYSLTMQFDKHLKKLYEYRLSQKDKNILTLKREYIKKIQMSAEKLIKDAINKNEKMLPETIRTAISNNDAETIIDFLQNFLRKEDAEETIIEGSIEEIDITSNSRGCGFILLRLMSALASVISLSGFSYALYEYFRTNENYQWGTTASILATVLSSFPNTYLSWIWGWTVPELLTKPPEPASLLFPRLTKIFKGTTGLLSFLSWATSIYFIVQAMVKDDISTAAMVGDIILAIVIALGTSLFNLTANLMLSEDIVEYLTVSTGKLEQRNLIKFYKIIKEYTEIIENMSIENFNSIMLESSSNSNSGTDILAKFLGKSYNRKLKEEAYIYPSVSLWRRFFPKARNSDANIQQQEQNHHGTNTDMEQQQYVPKNGLACGII